MTAKNCYNFSFTMPGGQTLKLADYEGKALLVVNTASACGFTEQYEALQRIYDAYRDRGLLVIAVPSNDFGHQEPGSDKEIQDFCQINYGVSFPVVAKVRVKGSNAHAFFQWAKDNLGFLSAPKWNFHKYLIDKNGRLLDFFLPTTAPDSPRVLRAIERALDLT